MDSDEIGLHIDEAPGKEEVEELNQQARLQERSWRKRSLIMLAALLSVYLLILPFSKGYSLSAHHSIFGCLVWLMGAVQLITIYCCALWWSTWRFRRQVENTYS
jgi:hypothetical protein